ncbi:MAG: glycosyltransferase family 2 protein [Ferroplasma sp.]|uniref:glycosyltransferase family 2 protein n=1 Tax=Ferroplasma sp. TaxID=2591003 RepID=UPI002815331E|nr:glycosyltransferase family 2 protein [Ferroplasma sp.]WMT50635.1 MAG: glycosyltransferase family 2 protein [Ferroplasma sp.]
MKNESRFISVIITIYKRLEFYNDAIQSVIDQSLAKDEYEIIVVHYIDIEQKFNNIKYIKCGDVTIGEQLSIGVGNSKGNIIVFLDDDDVFTQSKLQAVYNAFSDKKLVYLHNNHKNIDQFDKIINYNKYGSPCFNMSSISVRKDILNLIHLKQLEILQDTFMYFSAIEFKGKIKISNQVLTLYRIHDKNVSISKDLVESIHINISFRNQYIKFLNQFKTKKVINKIKTEITFWNIVLFINDSFEKSNIDIFWFLFFGRMNTIKKIKASIAFILYKHNIFRRFIKQIINGKTKRIFP